MIDSHIHTVNDGRPNRAIYCNGKRIHKCIFADENEGYAIAYKYPYVKNETGDELLTERHDGKITVSFALADIIESAPEDRVQKFLIQTGIN